MSTEQPFGDVLRCPICWNTYKNRILQCSQGHSVCELCYSKVVDCPTCRSIFSGVRNYALEEVVAKLHSLLPPEDDSTESDAANQVTDNTTEADGDEQRIIPLQRGPVQGSGHFRCRIDACIAYLPVCRMHNHLRYHHARQYSECKPSFADNELHFQENWRMNVVSMSRAVKIAKIGLFFLIVDVKEGPVTGADRIISSWVECVCPNENTRGYRFGCDMVFDQKAASYCDYVYGGNSDANEIKRSSQCLQVSVPINVYKIQVQIRIYKYTGLDHARRNSTTTLRSMPVIPTRGQRNHR